MQSPQDVCSTEMSVSVDSFWDYWRFYPRGILGRRWAPTHLQVAARLWPHVFHLHLPGQQTDTCPAWCPFLLDPKKLHCWRPVFTSRLRRYRDMRQSAPVMVNTLKSDAHNKTCLHTQTFCQCKPIHVDERDLQTGAPPSVDRLQRHLPACLARLVLDYVPSFGLTTSDCCHVRRLREYRELRLWQTSDLHL